MEELHNEVLALVEQIEGLTQGNKQVGTLLDEIRALLKVEDRSAEEELAYPGVSL